MWPFKKRPKTVVPPNCDCVVRLTKRNRALLLEKLERFEKDYYDANIALIKATGNSEQAWGPYRAAKIKFFEFHDFLCDEEILPKNARIFPPERHNFQWCRRYEGSAP